MDGGPNRSQQSQSARNGHCAQSQSRVASRFSPQRAGFSQQRGSMPLNPNRGPQRPSQPADDYPIDDFDDEDLEVAGRLIFSRGGFRQSPVRLASMQPPSQRSPYAQQPLLRAESNNGTPQRQPQNQSQRYDSQGFYQVERSQPSNANRPQLPRYSPQTNTRTPDYPPQHLQIQPQPRHSDYGAAGIHDWHDERTNQQTSNFLPDVRRRPPNDDTVRFLEERQQSRRSSIAINGYDDEEDDDPRFHPRSRRDRGSRSRGGSARKQPRDDMDPRQYPYYFTPFNGGRAGMQGTAGAGAMRTPSYGGRLQGNQGSAAKYPFYPTPASKKEPPHDVWDG